jgi:hypothetical protein
LENSKTENENVIKHNYLDCIRIKEPRQLYPNSDYYYTLTCSLFGSGLEQAFVWMHKDVISMGSEGAGMETTVYFEPPMTYQTSY